MSQNLEAALPLHRPALLRRGYRMLGSLAEAEDLTHDVLERASGLPASDELARRTAR